MPRVPAARSGRGGAGRPTYDLVGSGFEEALIDEIQRENAEQQERARLASTGESAGASGSSSGAAENRGEGGDGRAGRAGSEEDSAGLGLLCTGHLCPAFSDVPV